MKMTRASTATMTLKMARGKRNEERKVCTHLSLRCGRWKVSIVDFDDDLMLGVRDIAIASNVHMTGEHFMPMNPFTLDRKHRSARMPMVNINSFRDDSVTANVFRS